MFLSIALVAFALAQDAAPPAIAGRWINPARSVIIDIAPCDDAWCGTVQWASAKARQDARRGTERLVGTQLLTNLRNKRGRWQGRLFLPDQRLRATAKLTLVGDRQLKVSGCQIICKSQLWTRADGPLPASD
jgi:uncharacterized protein (DUF2147 family)